MEISPYAFDTLAFQNTSTLVLSNLNINIFDNDTFSGLVSLTSLKMYSIFTYRFGHGVLKGIAKTLESFLLYGLYTNRAINIDGFTGGTNMPRLTWVRIVQNLSYTVTKNTFTGVANVETIDLSGCSIEILGIGTFDPVKRTLIRLKLERNNLKSLPPGFFKKLLPSHSLLINLAENPWHCDCELNQFQKHLDMNIVSFVEQPICETPTKFHNLEILSVDLCQINETIHGPPPQAEHSNTDDDDNNSHFHSQECCNLPNEDFCEDLKMNSKNSMNAIREYVSTKTNYRQYASICDILLIWYDVNGSRKGCAFSNIKLECIGSFTKNLLNKTFTPNTVYIMCIMHNYSVLDAPVVNGINCTPYLHKSDDPKVWLFNSDTTGIIVGVALTLNVGLGVGFGIGYFLFRNSEEDEQNKVPALPTTRKSIQPMADEQLK